MASMLPGHARCGLHVHDICLRRRLSIVHRVDVMLLLPIDSWGLVSVTTKKLPHLEPPLSRTP